MFTGHKEHVYKHPTTRITQHYSRSNGKNYTQSEHINEIMNFVKIILNQNYFQRNNQTFKQQDGLAMCYPIRNFYTIFRT
jgi:hypothetical protein